MNKLMLLSSLVCVSVYGAARPSIKSSSEMRKDHEDLRDFFNRAMNFFDKKVELKHIEEKMEDDTLDEASKNALKQEFEQTKEESRTLLTGIPLRHLCLKCNGYAIELNFDLVQSPEEVLARILADAAREGARRSSVNNDTSSTPNTDIPECKLQ